MSNIVARENDQIQEHGGGQKAALVESASARQFAEVQAAMTIARQFPRDEELAYTKIKRACKRKRLADKAIFSFPRGGSKVTGPSIRLAEVLAQCWGNIDFGVIELEQRFDESTVMAYAWDLETNTRQVKTFQVRHIRHTRSGDRPLTDPRDIYELVANQGARRVRNCILGVIPGDIVDDAMDACRATMASGEKDKPLKDRIREMVAAFDDLGVTKDQLEAFVDAKAQNMTAQNVVDLADVYRSIRDKNTKPGDWFKAESPKVETLDDVVDAEAKEKK